MERRSDCPFCHSVLEASLFADTAGLTRLPACGCYAPGPEQGNGEKHAPEPSERPVDPGPAE